MTYTQQLLILCPLIFAASFIDAVAGGGGLISVPAYFLTGIPPKFALGSNKFSASLGTLIAAGTYVKSKKVDLYGAGISFVAASIGAYTGAEIAKISDNDFLSYFLLVALPIAAIIILKNKSFKEEDKEKLARRKKLAILCVMFGLVFGFYDGFFGPGTGTFLMIAYNFIGYDIVKASGNSKIVNLSSNLASCVSFLIGGFVLFELAIPASVASILGGFLGARLAVKNGSKIIRPILVTVLTLLLMKIAFDLFNI